MILNEEFNHRKGVLIQGGKCDEKRIYGKEIVESRFIDIGFRKSTIENCRFSHSLFERCYFKSASLIRVSFTGCDFKDCRFDYATLRDCNLERAEFQNCSISYKQVEPCFPKYENVLWALARNLRVNAQSRGHWEEYRLFLLREIKASSNYNKEKAFNRDDWHKGKYKFRDRWSGFRAWLRLGVEGFLWGYGESPIRVLRTGALIVITFSAVYWSLNVLSQKFASAQDMAREYFDLSLSTFVFGPINGGASLSFLGSALSITERALGLVIFGFFVTALYRWTSKR